MKRILKELELTHIASVDSPCQELALATITKRDFSDKERDKLSDTGAAMPDGSYPIKSPKDLENAVASYGRAKNPEAVKRHIIRRARSLGATSQLPPDWKVSKFADTPKEDLQLAALLTRKALLKARLDNLKGTTHTTDPLTRGLPKTFTSNPSPDRAKRVSMLKRGVAKMKKAWSDAAREAALAARQAGMSPTKSGGGSTHLNFEGRRPDGMKHHLSYDPHSGAFTHQLQGGGVIASGSAFPRQGMGALASHLKSYAESGKAKLSSKTVI